MYSIFSNYCVYFATSLLNKSIHFFQKRNNKNVLTPNFWTVVYIVTKYVFFSSNNHEKSLKNNKKMHKK